MRGRRLEVLAVMLGSFAIDPGPVSAQLNFNPCSKEHATIVAGQRSEAVRVCAESPKNTPVIDCGLVVKVTVPKDNLGVIVRAVPPSTKKECEKTEVLMTLYTTGVVVAQKSSHKAKGKWNPGGEGGSLLNPVPCDLGKELTLNPPRTGSKAGYRVASVQKGQTWNCVEIVPIQPPPK